MFYECVPFQFQRWCDHILAPFSHSLSPAWEELLCVSQWDYQHLTRMIPITRYLQSNVNGKIVNNTHILLPSERSVLNVNNWKKSHGARNFLLYGNKLKWKTIKIGKSEWVWKLDCLHFILRILIFVILSTVAAIMTLAVLSHFRWCLVIRWEKRESRVWSFVLFLFVWQQNNFWWRRRRAEEAEKKRDK